jgi:hypothetical protein
MYILYCIYIYIVHIYIVCVVWNVRPCERGCWCLCVHVCVYACVCDSALWCGSELSTEAAADMDDAL